MRIVHRHRSTRANCRARKRGDLCTACPCIHRFADFAEAVLRLVPADDAFDLAWAVGHEFHRLGEAGNAAAAQAA
jgi:hypothetical protein